ncbi:MAG: hypothetical protein JJU00_06975 [Opitutales bacterium]|nr:hypothetical protein [Opitutales bacterium]
MHYRTIILLVACLLPDAVRADTAEIDVMIVYTPAARDHAGGEAAMRADILATVAGANEVFANSGIDVVLRLVHTAEVDYTESGSFPTDLERITEPDSGYMDEVHEWRDAWGADIVSLFRRSRAANIAGFANLLEDEHGRPDRAFCVISDESALANHSFAHEIGHLLGSAHARGDDGSTGVFEHAHGYRFGLDTGPANATVMATFRQQDVRIPHFSNPVVSFEGLPTGIPAGEPESADNAAVFAQIAPIVAAYRLPQPETPVIDNIASEIKVATGQPALLGVAARGAPPLQFQWYEGEAGDTAAPLPDGDRPTVDPGNIDGTRTFWVRVWNDGGDAASSTVHVSAEPPPDGTPEIDQEQSEFEFVQNLAAGEWQAFVPETGFLASVELFLQRDGDPGDLVLEITDAFGAPLARRIVPEAEVIAGVPQANNAGWFSIPVELFVEPGLLLRISVSNEGAPGQNLRWAMTESVDYPHESSLRGASAFAFRTYGLPVDDTSDPVDPPVFTSGLPSDFALAPGMEAYLAVVTEGPAPVTYQWYRGAAGDTSDPLSGETAARLTTPPAAEDTAYWVRAENEGGHVESRSLSIDVADPPALTGTDQSQDTVEEGFIVAFDFWQRFVPAELFLDTVEVEVLRRGNPGDLVIVLTDDNLRPMAQRAVAEADIATSRSAVAVSFGVFLSTGKTYTLALREPSDGDTEDNYYVWFGAAGNPYPAGESILESNEPGFDFAFRTTGGSGPPAPAILGELDRIADGWVRSGWFGTVFPGGLEADTHGWLYHEHHQWLWLDQRHDNGEAVRIYDTEAGWMWTHPADYPYLHSTEAGWLYYDEGSTGPRRFYAVADGGWMEHP